MSTIGSASGRLSRFYQFGCTAICALMTLIATVGVCSVMRGDTTPQCNGQYAKPSGKCGEGSSCPQSSTCGGTTVVQLSLQECTPGKSSQCCLD
jgi:hypothetical protein